MTGNHNVTEPYKMSYNENNIKQIYMRNGSNTVVNYSTCISFVHNCTMYCDI